MMKNNLLTTKTTSKENNIRTNHNLSMRKPTYVANPFGKNYHLRSIISVIHLLLITWSRK
jgi:hypothetical protein